MRAVYDPCTWLPHASQPGCCQILKHRRRHPGPKIDIPPLWYLCNGRGLSKHDAEWQPCCRLTSLEQLMLRRGSLSDNKLTFLEILSRLTLLDLTECSAKPWVQVLPSLTEEAGCTVARWLAIGLQTIHCFPAIEYSTVFNTTCLTAA